MPKFRVKFVKMDTFTAVKELDVANLAIAQHEAGLMAAKGPDMEAEWEPKEKGIVTVTEVGAAPEQVVIDNITDEEGNVIEETDEEKRARVEKQAEERAEQAQRVADAEAAAATEEEEASTEVEGEEGEEGRRRHKHRR